VEHEVLRFAQDDMVWWWGEGANLWSMRSFASAMARRPNFDDEPEIPQRGRTEGSSTAHLDVESAECPVHV
jgi:hypothetical protein